MASDLALSSRPSSAFTAAAAFLTSISAYTTARGMRSPEMRKNRRERSVCAPHSRSAGTSIGPKLSFSMRLPLIAAVMLLLQRAAQRPRAGLGAPCALQLPALRSAASPPDFGTPGHYFLVVVDTASLWCPSRRRQHFVSMVPTGDD